MIHLRFATVVGFLALGATGAAAQNIDSPYRFVDPAQQVNGFVGLVETDPGTLGLGPESGLAYGLRYGIRLAGPFSVEASAAILPTHRTVRDTAIVGSDTSVVSTGTEADMTIGLGTADLRFDITGPRTWNRLMPFALLGIGGAFTLSDDDSSDEDLAAAVRYNFGTRLVGELGLGVEWFPTEHFTLRLDARNVLWRIDAPTGFVLLDVPREEWVQNFLLSAGVSFRF